MKNNGLMNMNFLRITCGLLAITSMGLLGSCNDDDDPKKEDTPELITKAALTFTPDDGGSAVVATASDPDGIGVQNIQPDGEITLTKDKTYTLTIVLTNELADPAEPGYNISAEVEEEADEHMFFFGWTNNVFSDPSGNGNMDSRSDQVNYEDEDDNGLPLGLQTTWTSTSASASGKFNVVLKHQPDLKSDSSPSTAGETDLVIEFTINIQ
jgi:hypothetical protein